MYKNIIMPFSNNFLDDDIRDHIKNNNFSHDNEIKVSKKIKSLRQLTKVEKELVKLVYKGAVLKCLSLEDTQKFIAEKIKILIDINCLEFLKKSEEQENREWYYRLAKDQDDFIIHHKKAMDKIEQCERELWGIVEDPDTKEKTKIRVIYELHKLAKTHVLLLRDMPFLTSLAKFFDSDVLDKEGNTVGKQKHM